MTEGIAIVGMGGCFPGAEGGVEEFWQNICAGRVAIREVPAERWDSSLYYSSDRTLPDLTYSRIGGFMDGVRFDARKFRIPPRTLASVDDIQKLALTAVADALLDAGLEIFPDRSRDGRSFDRERCAVILGNSMGGEYEDLTSVRVWYPSFRKALQDSGALDHMDAGARAGVLGDIERRFKATLPEVTEDSMPGELSNCITGRIANCFDLRGPNYTTDAACAASLAAVKTAVDGLRLGHYDLALAGGVDRSMDPPTYAKFSKIKALSATGSRPFDENADGFVMGEGGGVMVLKRLTDAERDGDRIYAVIRGIGAASDGRGKGMTAPNPKGQRLAVERAYEEADVPIETVGLFEAHGTSTPVGDAVELRVLSDALAATGTAPSKIPIGSVKSMIGHLKSAAGSAAIIKVARSLSERVLPPSANFERAPANSPLNDGYLSVSQETRPWGQVAGTPRRAGVSAFGFGGTNFHVVLEEYAASDSQVPGGDGGAKNTGGRSSTITAVNASSAPSAKMASDAGGRDGVLQSLRALFAESSGYEIDELDPSYELEADLGIDTVKQAEIFGVLRERFGLREDPDFRLSSVQTLNAIADYVIAFGDNQATELTTPKTTATAISSEETANADVSIDTKGPYLCMFGGDSAKDAIARAQSSAVAWDNIQPSELQKAIADERQRAFELPAKVAFVAANAGDIGSRASDAGTKKARMLAARGIFVNAGASTGERPKIALLFPGQGSQYLGMLKDLAARYAIVQETFAQADVVLESLLGERLTEILWPEAVNDDSHRQELERQLRRTEICQPAMLSADVAMMRLLREHGVKPDAVAGHSLGEYAACVAAGVLDFSDALYAVSARGREMAGIDVADPGEMATVAADSPKVEEILADIDGYVIAANKNCHSQTVIAGDSGAVENAMARFSELKIESRRIPVSHAFHTEIVAPAAIPLKRVLSGLNLNVANVPVISNVGAEYYPSNPSGIINTLSLQLQRPVEFIAQIERLWEDGVRVFVESGPRRAVTGFVRNILGKKEHLACATNHHKRDGVEAFLEALAALAAWGVPVATTTPSKDAGTKIQTSVVDSPTPDTAGPEHQTLNDKGHDSDVAATEPNVISGVAVVLPSSRPLDMDITTPATSDVHSRLLAGENFIEPIPDPLKRDILGKNIVRLNKTSGDFDKLHELGDVIQLAARVGEIDLVADYGIDSSLCEAFDSTSTLAVAVGIDALRDAGLPLMQHYRTTSTGKQLADRWGLPDAIARRTGVIFASAFPGIDTLIDDVSRNTAARAAARCATNISAMATTLRSQLQAAAGDADSDNATLNNMLSALDDYGEKLRSEADLFAFNRKFLFRLLAMGHAQVAQVIGAKGPNTQINGACASGPQAIAVADDWIRLGRCDRVLVVTSDNVTHDASLPWIGAGFLAAGAATINPEVTTAAVPFGAGRNGMIIGAGAAAFVIERAPELQKRGMEPIADVLATHFGNSAFHGTRLDPGYIRGAFKALTDGVASQTGWSTAEIARRSFFVSHETYTPARGGSSAAEIDAIRDTFGVAAKDLLIANTKGYTGHPMGATLEDIVALKGLQRQLVPAVANLREVDPDFADLTFAAGGEVDRDIALRFSAGFGSQVAMVAYRRRATEEARLRNITDFANWTLENTGATTFEVDHRTLRASKTGGSPLVELGIPSLQPMRTQKVEPTTADMSATTTATTDHPSLLSELTALFAEQTGYEPEELDPVYELESDLGIDTVKQAEIFGILRERYKLAEDNQFALSDVQTLNAIAKYVEQFSALHLQDNRDESAIEPLPNRDNDNPTKATPDDQNTAPVLTAIFGEQHKILLAELTELFALQTGYESEELDPSYELESDLGIDTVKQAEIFGILRERYELVEDNHFSLSNIQTLNAVVEYVIAKSLKDATTRQVETATATGETTVTKESTPREATEVGARARRGEDLSSILSDDPRFYVKRVELTEAPKSNETTQTLDLAKSRVLVCGKPSATRTELVASLEAVASTVVAVEPQSDRSDELAEMLRAQQGGAPEAVVYVLEPSVDSSKEAAVAVESCVAGVFSLAKAFSRTCASQTGTGFLIVGKNGVDMGFAASESGVQNSLAAVSGAVSGIIKSLGKELPDCRALYCEMSPNDNADSEQLKTLVTNCVRSWTCDDMPELVLRPEARLIPSLATTNVVSQALETEPELSDVVLVATGGAQGVTYEILRQAVQAGQKRVAIIARTAAIDPDHSPLKGLAASAQKDLAKKALLARGDKPVPMAVKRYLSAITKGEQVWRNIEILRQSGAEVLAITCDLSDSDSLAMACEQVLSHWKLPVWLLHGAGKEESKMLADKDDGALGRVFRPKAGALLRLSEGLKPKRVMTMGSVAGRFGNAGQVDYAAANEMMAGLARGAESHILNINWTAWGDVGMATRGSIESVLTSSGVELLPAAHGARLGAALLRSGLTGDVVVAGQLGRFAAAQKGHAVDVSATEMQDTGEKSIPALFHHADIKQQQATYTRRFDPTLDVGLDHHRIAGIALLPGVLGVELMAQAAGHFAGKKPTACIDVRFATPIKFHRDGEQEVSVTTVWRPDGHVKASVSTEFVRPSGQVVVRQHFEAIVCFEETQTVGDGGAETGEIVLPRDPRIDREALYSRYFHGPTFQVIGSTDALGDNGVRVTPVSERSPWLRDLAHQAFLSEPMLREVGFQAAGLFEMVAQQRLSLPAGIDYLSLEGVDDGRGAVRQPTIEVLHCGENEHGSRFDVTVQRSDGHKRVMMRGYHTTPLRQLDREQHFDVYENQDSSHPAQQWLAVSIPGVQAELDRDPAAAIKKYLSFTEAKRFKNLKTGKRRLEWFAGRVAAKRLIQQHFSRAVDEALDFPSIEILPDELGAPQVQLQGRSLLAPRLSISHSGGIAGAYLHASLGYLPGIDIERVETRDPGFLKGFFTDTEQQMVNDGGSKSDLITTTIWAIKEAYLKALGIGARVDLRELDVSLQNGNYQVALRGETRNRALALDAGAAQIDVELIPEHDPNLVVVRLLLPTVEEGVDAAALTGKHSRARRRQNRS